MAIDRSAQDSTAISKGRKLAKSMMETRAAFKKWREECFTSEIPQKLSDAAFAGQGNADLQASDVTNLFAGLDAVESTLTTNGVPTPSLAAIQKFAGFIE